MKYSSLSPKLVAQVSPSPVSTPAMVVFNHELRDALDLPNLSEQEWLKILSGNEPFENQVPFALAYAGHQYGRFTMLGDGRAHVIAEFEANNQRFDLQLKGSGTTPFSRGGDGRAVLGPMLREYLISEAMHALGIPTTRSLGVVSTGEVVYRETPLPGGILGRIAKSHIRVGTFQYSVITEEKGLTKTLADYAIARHYPHVLQDEEPYRRFLQEVIHRQAILMAKWMSVGFVHGVMNTDNMAISGETIDYGPCAFLDTYQPSIRFSSIDRGGRYAYNQQANIALWNLTRFAETLISLLDENQEKAIQIAEEDLATFSTEYVNEYYRLMGQKIGIDSLRETERVVVDRLLEIMEHERLDFTGTFIRLTNLEAPSESSDSREWVELWKHVLSNEVRDPVSLMKQVNPMVIPRNHIVQEALDMAEAGSYELFFTVLYDVQHPYREPKETRLLERTDHDEPFITYCGT